MQFGSTFISFGARGSSCLGMLFLQNSQGYSQSNLQVGQELQCLALADVLHNAMLLKLYSKSEFQLELVLDDDDNEPRSYSYVLKSDDLKIIPAWLRDVMHSVLKAKDSTRVIANTVK